MSAKSEYPPELHFDNFSLHFAANSEQRSTACRLRYEVFTRELGRTAYADHASETYADRLDVKLAHILLANVSNKSVGTLRFTLRADTEFLNEDELCLKDFLSDRNDSDVAIADRGAILPEFRRAGLYHQMWNYGFQFLRSRGVRFVIGVIDASDTKLISFHSRQGWTTLQENLEDAGKLWNSVLKELWTRVMLHGETVVSIDLLLGCLGIESPST